LTEALEQHSLLEEELLKLKRRVTGQQGLESLIKSNQRLGSNLQALVNQINTELTHCRPTALLPESTRPICASREQRSDLQTLQRRFASLDRQDLKPQLQTAIRRAWLDLAEIMGCEAADVSQMLSSKDFEVFFTGVLRAYQLEQREGVIPRHSTPIYL
jgi:hypothetical protein